MNESVAQQAFFERDPSKSNLYHPTVHARGPWDPSTLHGRVISGLLAYEAETNHNTPQEIEDFQVSRVTVDMFRVPPMAPVMLGGKVVRTGRRIKVIDVHLTTEYPERGWIEIARATVVMLRKTQNPKGTIWTPPKWGINAPDENLPMPHEIDGRKPTKIHKPIWQILEVMPGSPGRRGAWVREIHELIAGEITSPLVRVAQVADVANPFANSGTHGLAYINADVSLYLHRNPEGNWIGIENSYHGADNGTAVGTVTLYDKMGNIGSATVCGLAQARV
ncbi:thioesterase family protein [Dehalococcoidia bacterium]|nr:thioesterase family protein [Dehalococcoidia bacterium]